MLLDWESALAVVVVVELVVAAAEHAAVVGLVELALVVVAAAVVVGFVVAAAAAVVFVAAVVFAAAAVGVFVAVVEAPSNDSDSGAFRGAVGLDAWMGASVADVGRSVEVAVAFVATALLGELWVTAVVDWSSSLEPLVDLRTFEAAVNSLVAVEVAVAEAGSALSLR